MQLGINLNLPTYWNTTYPFTDLMKSANKWQDDKSLSADDYPNAPNKTSISFLAESPYQEFIVEYQGEALIKFPNNLIEKTGENQYKLTANNKPLFLALSEITKPVTNLSVKVARQTTTQFNQEWLDVIAPFQVLRFMDWQQTNNSDIREWQDRATTDLRTYCFKGVPLEEIIDLIKLTGKTPWFTVPHLASENYIQSMAVFLKETLPPKSKIYLEYSNELWNRSFKQSSWAFQQAKASGLSVHQFVATKTAQVIQIFKTILGEDRVIGALGCAFSSPYWAKQCLNYAKKANLKFDAIAVGAYFGFTVGLSQSLKSLRKCANTKIAVDQVMASLATTEIDKFKFNLSKHQEIALEYNIPLVAYEGGQHLVARSPLDKKDKRITEIFTQANKDARIGDLYSQILSTLTSSECGLFCHYYDVGGSGLYGSWGARESLLASNSKYDQLVAFING